MQPAALANYTHLQGIFIAAKSNERGTELHNCWRMQRCYLGKEFYGAFHNSPTLEVVEHSCQQWIIVFWMSTASLSSRA